MLVQTAEVDEIRKERGERDLRLYLVVERGEWLLPRSLWLLQEKLNGYASFILDGKLADLYPWAQPGQVQIIVQSHGQAPAGAHELLAKVREVLEPLGPRVLFEQAPS